MNEDINTGTGNIPIDDQVAFYNNYWSELKPFSRFKIARIIKIIGLIQEVKAEIKKPDILDLGCGDGRSVAIWNLFGRASGFDLSSGAIETARKMFPLFDFHSGNANENGLPSSGYDIIISQEVLEHIEEQEKYIEECNRLLKPGGYLILTTPNKYYFDRTRKGNYSNQPIEKILYAEELKRIVETKFKIKKLDSLIIARGDFGPYRILSSIPLVALCQKTGLEGLRQRIMSKRLMGLHLCVIAKKLK